MQAIAARLFPISLLSVMSLMPPDAAAEIYKWQDANGRTVFSASPPRGADSTIVKPKTGKASEQAIQKLHEANTPTKDTKPKAEDKAAAAPPEPTAKQRSENCAKARESLFQLQHHTRMQQYDDKKQLRFLTEEERQQRIKDSEVSIKSWCGKK